MDDKLKYIKYKTKYRNLKNKLNKNSKIKGGNNINYVYILLGVVLTTLTTLGGYFVYNSQDKEGSKYENVKAKIEHEIKKSQEDFKSLIEFDNNRLSLDASNYNKEYFINLYEAYKLRNKILLQQLEQITRYMNDSVVNGILEELKENNNNINILKNEIVQLKRKELEYKSTAQLNPNIQELKNKSKDILKNKIVQLKPKELEYKSKYELELEIKELENKKKN